MICQNTGDAKGSLQFWHLCFSHILPWRLLPGLVWTNSDVSFWFYLRSQVANQQSNLLFHRFFSPWQYRIRCDVSACGCLFFFLLFSFSNQLFYLSDLSQCTDMKEKPKTGDSWHTGTQRPEDTAKGEILQEKLTLLPPGWRVHNHTPASWKSHAE